MQMSMLDKLKLIVDLSCSNVIYIAVLCALLFLSILFMTTNKKNKKESFKTYLILYLIVAIFTVVKFHASLLDMWDNMMNNLFIVFYFPNISVYFFAILVTNIIMWITMFSNKTSGIIKVINSIVFLIIHYLLVLGLGVINNNKLDVFDTTSLYGNGDFHAIVEITGLIFILWIIFLTIYKIINSYLNRGREVKVFEEVKNKVTSSHSIIKNVCPPLGVKRVVKDRPVIYQKPINPNTLVYEQMLTVEDYKLLLSILREERKKKEMDLSYNPIREVRNQTVTSNSEFNKLMELYGKGM